MSIKDTAREYIGYGLQPLPLKNKGSFKKRPSVNTWKSLRQEALTIQEADLLFSKKTIRTDTVETENRKTGEIDKGVIPLSISDWIGIITGAVSVSLEVIDVDCKYDLKGSLWSDYLTLIGDNLPIEVKNALVIAKTISGGYHIYYRCPLIEGNQKLANRAATETEREEDPKEKVKVLIETRGEGGYVVAPPTPGYTFIQGTPDKIPTITKDQREILLTLAKGFNTYEEVQLHSSTARESDKGVSKKTPTENRSGLGLNTWEGVGSFEDYNDRGDICELLIRHGWKEVENASDRIIFLRPGQTNTASSANWHKSKRLFKVWSSSTVFKDIEKAYNLSQVYAILEHGGDLSEASKKLYEMGYGDKKPKQRANVPDRNISKKPLPNVPARNIRETATEPTVTEQGGSIFIGYDNDTPESKINDILEKNQESKVYLRGEDGKTVPEYEYKLNRLKAKYEAVEETTGGILLPPDQDNFIEEAVAIANRFISPIDRDRFTKLFISFFGEALRISEESLKAVEERLRYKADKDKQARDLKALLSEAGEIHGKGDTEKALDLLESRIKRVRLTDKATSFHKLREIITEQDLKQYFSKTPESLRSGYTIKGEELLFPSGALTGIAGATGHGKTDFLINTTLKAVTNHKDKEFYFFTYEMSQEAILVRFLNTYIGIDLSKNPSNQRVIKEYLRTGKDQYIKSEIRADFHKRKQYFFEEIIGSGRLKVKGVDYLAPELNLAFSDLAGSGKVGGFFIDYFQLLRLPKEGYKNYSRQEELKVICQDLNTTAKELKLPIILNAQFNREVTTPFRLHATNIGEAGDIERILDTLIGIWNTSKAIVDRDLSKAEQNYLTARGLTTPNQLYAYVLKSRETASDTWELLDYNGKLGVISNQGKEADISF